MVLLQIFDKLKKECPDYKDKFHAVGGDMLHDGLGICDDDVRLLEDEINIVFHSAATIRFDEPLR